MNPIPNNYKIVIFLVYVVNNESTLWITSDAIHTSSLFFSIIKIFRFNHYIYLNCDMVIHIICI